MGDAQTVGLIKEVGGRARRIEFSMHDLKRIAHGIVLTLQRTKRRQNLIVNALHQHYFVKGVKGREPCLVLEFFLFVLGRLSRLSKLVVPKVLLRQEAQEILV